MKPKPHGSAEMIGIQRAEKQEQEFVGPVKDATGKVVSVKALTGRGRPLLKKSEI